MSYSAQLREFFFRNQLIDAGKTLLHLPSSTPELLNLLKQLKKMLCKVNQEPSESISNALRPIKDAMITKQLLKHSDMDVNISVVCSLCYLFRITAPNSPYNDEQTKEFFELVALTLEKLSSTFAGCYSRMIEVLEIFCNVRLPVLMLDLQLDGLIIRIFKQFLTVADSNAFAVVNEMEKIMTMIVEESDEVLISKLVDLLITNVKEDKKIASPVCWELREKVVKNCAAKLKPHLLDTEDKGTVQPTTDTSKLRKNTTHTMKLRNMAQTVKPCQHSQGEPKHKKQTLSSDDSPTASKSVTEVKGKRKRNSTPLKEQPAQVQKLPRSVASDPPNSVTEVEETHRKSNTPSKEQAQTVKHGENLVGRTILVWWPLDREYKHGVVKCCDSIGKKHEVLYDDGDEELLDLEHEQWALVENESARPDHVKKSGLRRVQGYMVKKSIAPTLEAIFKKHGDIASECLFKTASTREFHLELLCEVVRQIQRNEVIDMQEIECKLSDAEAAKLNVSWLRTHLESLRKRKEMMLNSTLLMETKENTNLVKEAAQTDLKERHAKLVDAEMNLKKRRIEFEKAERWVNLLQLIEEKVNANILKTNAEKDSWVEQPVI